MEETEKQTEEVKEVEEPKRGGKAKKWIGGAILLVVLLVVGVYVVDTIQKNQKKEAIKEAAVELGTDALDNALEEAAEKENKVDALKDAAVDKGTEAVSEAIRNAAEEKMGASITTVEVEGSNYKFSPTQMIFSAGEQVELAFMVTEGTHDFVIDELGVQTDVINAGEEVTVSFIAPDEPGEYAYYCSVGNHRSLGMEGVLVVE